MLVTKFSPFSGKNNTREIEITPEQIARWQAGEYIQNVCPHLSADDREFLISGMTPEEWKEMCEEDWKED